MTIASRQNEVIRAKRVVWRKTTTREESQLLGACKDRSQSSLRSLDTLEGVKKKSVALVVDRKGKATKQSSKVTHETRIVGDLSSKEGQESRNWMASCHSS